MHRDEEACPGSGEDVEGEGGDEEMKGCKGALTLSKGRVVEDGLIYEDLMSRQTLASRDLGENHRPWHEAARCKAPVPRRRFSLTIPMVAKVFTTIQNVNRTRLLRMAACALAPDTCGPSSISSLFNFPSESMLSRSVLVELPPSLLPSADSPGSRSRPCNSVCFSESLREASILLRGKRWSATGHEGTREGG